MQKQYTSMTRAIQLEWVGSLIQSDPLTLKCLWFMYMNIVLIRAL